MANRGDKIVNRVTGEHITWLDTASDTAGKFLRMEFTVAPKGLVQIRHIHPNQTERFEIIEGELKIEQNGHYSVLTPGDKAMVPKHTPHQWWNNSGTEIVKMIVTLEPALNSEVLFEQFFGLANDGKTNKKGLPNLMQSLAFCNAYQSYIAGPPIFVQRTVSFFLGGLANLLGYKTFYKKYSAEKL
jgi:quercetin dioxygenase-like cupin family protein